MSPLRLKPPSKLQRTVLLCLIYALISTSTFLAALLNGFIPLILGMVLLGLLSWKLTILTLKPFWFSEGAILLPFVICIIYALAAGSSCTGVAIFYMTLAALGMTAVSFLGEYLGKRSSSSSCS